MNTKQNYIKPVAYCKLEAITDRDRWVAGQSAIESNMGGLKEIGNIIIILFCQ